MRTMHTVVILMVLAISIAFVPTQPSVARAAATSANNPIVRTKTLLLRLGSNTNATTRSAAIQHLIEIGPPAVPYLVGAMQDPVTDMEHERSIALILYGMGTRAVPDLVALLRTESMSRAAAALANIGAPAIPYLLGELRQPEVRMVPAEVQLGYMAYADNNLAKYMIPTLVSMVRGENGTTPATNTAAISVLGRLGAPATPAVLTLLNDRDAKVRFKAVMVSGLMGLTGRDALPKLRSLSRSDPDSDVRKTAKMTVEYIESLGR
jgi:HEAT repeat protein